LGTTGILKNSRFIVAVLENNKFEDTGQDCGTNCMHGTTGPHGIVGTEA
jgi:hypothetical protein